MAKMMKAALWTGPEQVEFREIPRPTPHAGEVLVKVAYGGICGTDMMIYLGKHPRSKAPLVMSHEFSGTIAEDATGTYAPGTPVVVNPLLMCGVCWPCRNGLPHVCAKLGLVGIDRDGGFAEYVATPLHTIRVIPATLPLAQAALVEPLAVGVHAVRASKLKVGDITAVLGMGPVGNMVAQVARLAGARRVLVSERSPKRIAIARAQGFEVIDTTTQDAVAAIMEATGGDGVPVVFESAGVQPTINDAIKVVRGGGELLQVGMPKSPPTVDVVSLQFREVVTTPIRVYREEDFNIAVALAPTGKIDLVRPTTHVLPLEKLHEAMELAHAAADSCKILLDAGA